VSTPPADRDGESASHPTSPWNFNSLTLPLASSGLPPQFLEELTRAYELEASRAAPPAANRLKTKLG
jgi:hypothetical protein